MLERNQTRMIFDQVKDDSSSLICLCDSTSFCSSWSSTTGSSSLLSKIFGFDGELLASKAYKRQARELFKLAIRSRRAITSPSKRAQKLFPNLTFPNKDSVSRPVELDKQLAAERKAQQNEIKVLLFGLPHSGQIDLIGAIMIQGIVGDFSIAERKSCKQKIFSDIVQRMRAILETMEERETELEDQALQYHVQTIFRQPSQIEESQLPPEIGQAISKLWTDSGVKRCYVRLQEESCLYPTTRYVSFAL